MGETSFFFQEKYIEYVPAEVVMEVGTFTNLEFIFRAFGVFVVTFIFVVFMYLFFAVSAGFAQAVADINRHSIHRQCHAD